VIYKKFQEKCVLHTEANLFWCKNLGKAKNKFSSQKFFAILAVVFEYMINLTITRMYCCFILRFKKHLFFGILV
jgi:hypothetical protein